jgi:hypothetical protein
LAIAKTEAAIARGRKTEKTIRPMMNAQHGLFFECAHNRLPALACAFIDGVRHFVKPVDPILSLNNQIST